MITTKFFMCSAIGTFIAAIGFTLTDKDTQLAYSSTGAAIALVILALMMAGWFVLCFVFAELPSDGPNRDMALRDMYAFAYAFTGLALALLAFPFGNLLNQGSYPESGPIRILQGCVVVPPISQPASAASTPSWPKGLPVCGGGGETHTVLVSIGGVMGKPAPAASTPQDTASSPTMTNGKTAIYEVSDGFVVPLLMIVLAVIGAAINLMRRIPEFQKRADINFPGTDKDKPLQPCEAREFVAFQILQLVAAPFIAMVAFYAIAPNSLPSAIALAFTSGFFSEGLLLRIRALGEGTEKTATVANAQSTSQLDIYVLTNSQPQPGMRVLVTQLSNNQQAGFNSNQLGRVTVNPPLFGKLKVEVTDPLPPGRVGQPVFIQMATGQKQSIDYEL